MELKDINSYLEEFLFVLTYEIPSNSTRIYEEYFIYDGINVIGSVGGTLGLCIGFSFTGLISSLLNILQNTICINKTKLANRKLSKSKPRKNGLSNNRQVVEDKGKQMGNVDGHNRKNVYSDEDLEERFKNMEKKMKALELEIKKTI